MLQRNQLPKHVKTPSDWLIFRVGIEFPKNLSEEEKKSNKALIAEMNAALKQTIDDAIRGKDQDAILKRSTQKKTHNTLSSVEEKKYQALQDQLELSKFKACLAVVDKHYRSTKPGVLKSMLGETLQEIYKHYPTMLPHFYTKSTVDEYPAQKKIPFIKNLPPPLKTSVEKKTEPVLEKKSVGNSTNPIEWLKERTKNIAENYAKLHISGDHQDDSKAILAFLKQILNREVKVEEEDIDLLEDFYRLDSDTDIYGSKVDDDFVFDMDEKTQEAIQYAFFYYLNLKNLQTEVKPDHEKLKIAQEFKEKHQQKIDELNAQRAAKEQAFLARRQHELKQVEYQLVLLPFVDHLEKLYRDKLADLAENPTHRPGSNTKKLKAFFENLTSSTLTQESYDAKDYIADLNASKGHHLFRMIVLTLNDIYQNFSHLLPKDHKKLFTEGIKSLPEYHFKVPGGDVEAKRKGLR